MGSSERPIFRRKTMPESDKGSRLSQNGNGTHTRVETQVFSMDSFRDGQRIPGTKFELPLPPTPFQVTAFGGGRAIGGGTSKESIRRAKKRPS